VSVGARTKEFEKNDFALLHYKFFYKGEWGRWCRVIAFLMSFMPIAIFVSSFSSFQVILWTPCSICVKI
jgi:hypothetical protein